MTEEDSKDPEKDGIANPNAPGKVDSDISKWVKNLGAIVTILTALVGLCFTAYQLQLKSAADKDAAILNRDAEDDKLKLGLAQLRNEAEDRAKDERQREYDFELQKEKLSVENQQARDSLEHADAKAENDQLSSVINHLFAMKDSSEGELATLFQYVGRGATNDDIVENAVLARLENPRTPEEIDLGFRLFEKMGPKAVGSIVRANLSARRRYDDEVVKEFQDLSAIRAAAHKTENPDFSTAIVYNQLKNETTLDLNYVMALMKTKLAFYVPYTDQSEGASRANHSDGILLSVAVIERSNLSLIRLIRAAGKLDLDISRAYVTKDLAQSGLLVGSGIKVECTESFVEMPYLQRDLGADQLIRLSRECPTASSAFPSGVNHADFKLLPEVYKKQE